MNLHEFQAKEFFELYDLPVSKRSIITKKEDIKSAFSAIDSSKGCVAKVQAHTGGRGKVGGVKVCKTIHEVELFVEKWLGKNIITIQTGDLGLPVNILSLEELTDISREIYFSLVVDRGEKAISLIVSEAGGMNIEEVAEETPEKILKAKLDENFELENTEIMKISDLLNFNEKQKDQFKTIVDGSAKLFKEKDLSLLEINPLVVKANGDLLCLDAKINVDENALFRQEEIELKRDSTQEDSREYEAKVNDLSYVSLEGNIGCMVNGAGLAMGTMDTIKFYGGNPANFLDVGGTATQERVAKAFKIILADKNVKVVLVNIFGGIVRCDLISEGIIAAINDVGVKVPVVVRLEGNNADLGSDILKKSGIEVESINNLAKAAQKAVELSK